MPLQNLRTKLTPEILADAKTLRSLGLSYAKIARYYEVNARTATAWLNPDKAAKARERGRQRREAGPRPDEKVRGKRYYWKHHLRIKAKYHLKKRGPARAGPLSQGETSRSLDNQSFAQLVINSK